MHEDNSFNHLDKGVREEPRGAEEVDSQRGGAQSVRPRTGEVVRRHFYLSSILSLKLCPSGLAGEDSWARRRVQLSGEVTNFDRLHLY